MSKFKKKMILIICIVTILAGAVLGVMRHRERVRAMEEERIGDAYFRIHSAISIADSIHFSQSGIRSFQPLPEVNLEINRFGVDVYLYLLLRLYERETGNVLTYDTVIDYFSEEFEPDGSLRLYNNGKHPEIQAFVEWVYDERLWRDRSHWREWNNYSHRIWSIYRDYLDAYPQEFEHVDSTRRFLRFLSPQMLDALARAEADPNYVLDLTSLQRAGY